VTLEEANKAMRELLLQPGYLRIEKPLLSYDQVLWLIGGAAVGAAGAHRRHPDWLVERPLTITGDPRVAAGAKKSVASRHTALPAVTCRGFFLRLL
jgi:hypothetical protein